MITNSESYFFISQTNIKDYKFRRMELFYGTFYICDTFHE